ncbi:MAG: DUF362 domain-containing protein [Deltaproteobacteria bacterium]|nr:DUF362 domain-containing protein [Deltaproteobacteria bacterium]
MQDDRRVPEVSAAASKKDRPRSKVALVRGDDRGGNILRCLELIEDQIRLGRRIVIKPNLVSIRKALSVTHAEALEAVLRFVRQRTDAEITVAEGCAIADAMQAFEKYGLAAAGRHYGVRLVDLNRDQWVPVKVVDRDLRPMTLRFSRTVAESDCRISLAPMKTHDAVIITMSLKNLVMGSLINNGLRGLEGFMHGLSHLLRPRDALYPRGFGWVVRHILRSDKVAMHQTYQTLNYNLFLLARAFPAHLAVLDGFTAMEGRGPTQGKPVDLRLALASADFIAADSVAARIMGFDPQEVGYLYYAIAAGLGEGDLERIEVLGDRWEDCLRPFEPHPNFKRQRAWRHPELDALRTLLPS